MSLQDTDLQQNFEALIQHHLQKPSMYFLGEGDQSVCRTCRTSLELLSKHRIQEFYLSDTAVPNFPILVAVHKFLGSIRQCYSGHESELEMVFVKTLAPTIELPLRPEVLTSMSLCSAMVRLHDEKLQKFPTPAHIDGYYDLVAPVADNELRIPLIVDGNTPPPLPPSLTFFVQEPEERAAQKFIVQKAHKKGRDSQFHAFMSIVAKTDPRDDLMHMFRCAITSYDLSFATALCVCDSEAISLPLVARVLNLMATDGLLDHFLRSLACAVRKIVTGRPPANHIELTALVNCWVAASIDWTCNLRADGGIEQLITNFCKGLRYGREVPDMARYIAKAVLTIAAYEDKCGDVAIAMLLQVLIWPLALKFNLDDKFRMTKENILHNSPTVAPLRSLIEDTIVTVLGSDVSCSYFPKQVLPDLAKLYKHALKNVGVFVQILILLNSRNLFEHPPIQTLVFALEKAAEVHVKLGPASP